MATSSGWNCSRAGYILLSIFSKWNEIPKGRREGGKKEKKKGMEEKNRRKGWRERGRRAEGQRKINFKNFLAHPNFFMCFSFPYKSFSLCRCHFCSCIPITLQSDYSVINHSHQNKVHSSPMSVRHQPFSQRSSQSDGFGLNQDSALHWLWALLPKPPEPSLRYL